MKKFQKFFTLVFIVSLLLSLSACASDEKNADGKLDGSEKVQKDDVSEEMEMNEEKLFDFKFLNRAPETTKDKPMDDVIKVFFHETSNDEPYKAIAIDLENKVVYVEPSLSIRGVTGDSTVHSEYTDDVYDILEKYEVSTWESEYIVGNPDDSEDGFQWRLLLQFKDGTVKTYKGNDEKEKPKTFDEFSKKLHKFSERESES